MKAPTERQLSDYLDMRAKADTRFLSGRIFRGVVRSVRNPSVGLYLVTVIRTDDVAGVTDLTSYACTVPGYIPLVGDVVDLIWRSKDEAVVFQPVTIVTPNQSLWYRYRARAWRSAALNQTSNSTFIQVPFDSQSYDLNNNLNGAVYTVPLTGIYHIDGRLSILNSVRSIIAIFVNAGEAMRGGDYVNSGNDGYTVSGDLALTLGNTVDMRFWQGDNVSHAIQTGVAILYMSVHYLGPSV